jgi:hypothetical protein
MHPVQQAGSAPVIHRVLPDRQLLSSHDAVLPARRLGDPKIRAEKAAHMTA